MAVVGINSTWGAESWSNVLIQALAHESAVLQTVRATPVAGRVAHLPRLLVAPAASWTSEGSEITSDAGSADTIALTPKKLANVVSLSNESIADSAVAELDAVGRALVRGVAQQVDARFFSSTAVSASAPAGMLATSNALPAETGSTINIETILTAIGTIGAAGGVGDVAYVSPGDLSALQLEALGSGYALLADPQAPGINRIGGASLVPSNGLSDGTAVVADSAYVVFAVGSDASVEFSEHAKFTADSVAARVVMRVDWAPADPAAFVVLRP